MHGSFGTEKEHYGLNRIKARTERNEIFSIFFGVHTANAVRIAEHLAVHRSNGWHLTKVNPEFTIQLLG